MNCCYVIPYVEATDALKTTISQILAVDGNSVVAVKDTPRGAEPEPEAGQLKHAVTGNLHLLSDGVAKGYTRSVNLGARWAVKHCAPDMLCLLNDDVIFAGGRIPELSRTPADAGLVGVISNRAGYQSLQYGFDENGDFVYPDHDIDGAAEFHRNLVDRVGARFLHVPLVHGFGFYIRPYVLETLGWLDEQRFPLGYGSDFDLSLRAQDAGYRNYVWTGDFVWHIGARTAGAEQRHIRAVTADFALKLRHGEQYTNAKFKTRVRMNNHTGNFLELA
jgi:GT2 family glycosyltransferase